MLLQSIISNHLETKGYSPDLWKKNGAHWLVLLKFYENSAKMIIVPLLFSFQVEADHCVWYGECGESTVPGKKYNCNYTGPPIPLPSEGDGLLTVGIAHFFFLCRDGQPWILKINNNPICFMFTCRSFALDLTMEIEVCAVMLSSCKLSKEVSSYPYSFCLGMYFNWKTKMEFASFSLKYFNMKDMLSASWKWTVHRLC